MPSDNDDFNPSDLKSRLGVGDEEDETESEGDDEAEPDESDEQIKQTRPDAPSAKGAGEGPPPSTPDSAPSESGEAGGVSSGPSSESPPSGGSPSSGGPPSGGPPGGPPPAGDAGPSRSEGPSPEEPETASSTPERDDPLEPEEELDEELDLDGQSGLDAATLALSGLVLLVGIAFGYVATTTYQFRQMYKERTRAAKRVLEAVKPKVQAYESLKSTIETLDPNEVEFEKAKKLAEKEIAVDATVFGRDRLVLGPQRTSLLTSYLVDAERLAEAIDEHRRLTVEQPHKKRLKEIAGRGGGDGKKKEKDGGKKGGTGDGETRYGVVFDFQHLKRNALTDGYKPHEGKIVKLLNFDSPKKGKVKFRLPDKQRVHETKLESVVPLSRGDVLTSGGRNAFELYKERVQNLKLRIKKIGPTPRQLIQKLEELAERPPPPLLKFTT
ncbi:MAG: hypothetical protein ABEL76_01090 [Bradymonadaceae bacterium]